MRKEWETVRPGYTAAYNPQVSVGWDSSPRTPKRVGAVINNNTPVNFEKALRGAKAFVDAHPGAAPPRTRLLTSGLLGPVVVKVMEVRPCE